MSAKACKFEHLVIMNPAQWATRRKGKLPTKNSDKWCHVFFFCCCYQIACLYFMKKVLEPLKNTRVSKEDDFTSFWLKTGKICFFRNSVICVIKLRFPRWLENFEKMSLFWCLSSNHNSRKKMAPFINSKEINSISNLLWVWCFWIIFLAFQSMQRI